MFFLSLKTIVFNTVSVILESEIIMEGIIVVFFFMVRDQSFIRGGVGLVKMGWGSYVFEDLKMGGCIKLFNFNNRYRVLSKKREIHFAAVKTEEEYLSSDDENVQTDYVLAEIGSSSEDDDEEGDDIQITVTTTISGRRLLAICFKIVR